MLGWSGCWFLVGGLVVVRYRYGVVVGTELVDGIG